MGPAQYEIAGDSVEFFDRVLRRTTSLREVEGACGICHGTLEAIIAEGGSVSAYEEPKGIRAVVRDDRGVERGEGFDIVWSPAILAAELDAGAIPEGTRESLAADALSSSEEIELVASVHGYGRVLTPSVLGLRQVNNIGGRTLIRREGLGVRATMIDAEGRVITESSISYCPTCAIAKAAVSDEGLRHRITGQLRDARNTGRVKCERGLENRYEARGGGVRVSILDGDKVLADRVLGCCIAYSTTKAEIAAGLIPSAGAKRFKAYCNLCPMKHCWMEKSMGAMGNVVLHRLSELGTEIEVSANGLIVARLPGEEEIVGRGTLCSLSALTNMLITREGDKVLKPSPARRFPRPD